MKPHFWRGRPSYGRVASYICLVGAALWDLAA